MEELCIYIYICNYKYIYMYIHTPINLYIYTYLHKCSVYKVQRLSSLPCLITAGYPVLTGSKPCIALCGDLPIHLRHDVWRCPLGQQLGCHMPAPLVQVVPRSCWMENLQESFITFIFDIGFFGVQSSYNWKSLSQYTEQMQVCLFPTLPVRMHVAALCSRWNRCRGFVELHWVRM